MINGNAKLTALEIECEILDAVHEAVSRGEDGITFKEAVYITGLSYYDVYSSMQELAVMGRVTLGSRADSNITRICLPDWEPPQKLNLTSKQQSVLNFLVSHMDGDGIAYLSFEAIAKGSIIPVGGIVFHIDTLDKKGYLSVLLRGKGARRTTFQVFPDGDGPRGYSPFHRGMIPAPDHLGIPMPPEFKEWAPGKTVAEAVSFYSRSAPVIRRWFQEAGVAPTIITKPKKPVKAKEQRDPILVYPFLVRDRGTPEHILMRRVNEAVPKWLPPDRRADICQDMIVAILCGDIDEAALDLPAKEFTKSVLRQHPTMFGDLSLDAPIGDSNFTILDTLSTDNSIWNQI